MALTSFDKKYLGQLELVLEILPWIAKEGSFALKGGTAINLFEHGLPRLSDARGRYATCPYTQKRRKYWSGTLKCL
jgi:hypothetical protein